MPYVTLVARQDEFTSDLGFNLLDTPEFEGRFVCLDGTVIAHDIVEHCHGADRLESINDELEALGAIWHSRGRWGDIGNMVLSSEETLGNEIYDLFRKSLDENEEVTSTKRRLLRCDAREAFVPILREARKIFRECSPFYERQEFNSFEKAALSRLCAGFNHMNRRFPSNKYNQFASHSLFFSIKQAVAEAVREISYPGQEFRLFYSLSESRVYPLKEDFYD
jgi:hypothetical protein